MLTVLRDLGCAKDFCAKGAASWGGSWLVLTVLRDFEKSFVGGFMACADCAKGF